MAIEPDCGESLVNRAGRQPKRLEKAVREFLTKVGDKWSILLVVMLAREPQSRARFSTAEDG
jgi:DNA-binding HxlR family transcriptional regulator